MFSNKRVRLSVFATVVVVGGLFAYVAGAYNVERARIEQQPSASVVPDLTLTPWGESLSAEAVDSAGIETDLDGNTSALFASDWIFVL
jgi:hypothetical protein